MHFDARWRLSALIAIRPIACPRLAGTGTAVILATKAPWLGIANPNAKILTISYTRSLRD